MSIVMENTIGRAILRALRCARDDERRPEMTRPIVIARAVQ